MMRSRPSTKSLSAAEPSDSSDGEDVNADLGRRVANARGASGLTLAAVAQSSGLSPGFISQIESGSANPTVASLVKLASALGRSVGQLFSDVEPPPATGSPGFSPRYAPVPQVALSAGGAGIWDLTAHESSRLMIRLVRGSAGDHAEPVQHPHEEFVCVLAGSCRLEVGSSNRLLGIYDSCHLPGAEVHHITEESPDLLLLIVLTQE